MGTIGLSFVSPAKAAMETASASPAVAQISTKTRVFNPGVFQESDGAMPMINNDDRVDAYFATKALLTAREAGLDIREAGTKWVEWLLPRQKADGRFERYLRVRNAAGEQIGWKANDIADADDALLALWLEVLYAVSPPEGMPAHWQKSAALASAHLETLRVKSGVYIIAQTNRVGLFMDNAEIYASYMNIAADQKRMGYGASAERTLASAQNLGAAIQKTFWDAKTSEFRVSTQDIPDSKFYPRATAQIFPMLSGIQNPIATNTAVFDEWVTKHGDNWLSMRYDKYSWGLVAFAAWKVGDNNTALAWQHQHRELRFGPRWTVVDEAIYQSLESNISPNIRLAADPRLGSDKS